MQTSGTMRTPGVLETTLPVIEQARHVTIDQVAVTRLCRRWHDDPFPVPPWDDEVHAGGDPNAVLLLDALNFCFWPDPGKEKWSIDYRGRRLNGYMALAASLKRARDEGIPIFGADYLASLTEEQLAHVFRGHGSIPMLPERVANAREVGRVLQERFSGSFAEVIGRAAGSAVTLVELLVEHFPSFRDVTTYAGREVRFYKRAQICVIDLVGTFGGDSWGRFEDADRLTAFADYKIPQVLRAYGVLRYSPELAATVDDRMLIPAGDPREVEIRAAMVWAVEHLRRGLAELGRTATAYELDWFLWNLGQRPVENERPYHLTRTIYY